MQSGGNDRGGGRFSTRVSRQLTVAFAIGTLLLAAALGAAWWMARAQDATLRRALNASVVGAVQAFAGAARTSALDYAIWDEAFARLSQNDADWMARNIGASIGLGTFQMAVVLPPGTPATGFDAAGIPRPAATVIEPGMLAALTALINGTPLGARRVATAFGHAGGADWLFAVARVEPQTTPLPAGTPEAALPRVVFGYRLDATLLGELGRFQMLDGLALASTPPADGRDGEPLPGPDGRPVAWLTWTAPTPGHAVLRAFLAPLAALVVALGGAALLVLRESVRSARRLEAAVARAHAADAAKTEFLSNVSHELRTPLGGIIGLARLLQTHELDAESREMVDLLLASAHSQLHLVNGLLDIARIETGALRLAQTPFDAAALVEETVKLALPDAAAKGIALAATIAPEARRPILGDAHAFRQIVTNLVGNAVKFTEAGRVAVELAPGASGLGLVVADSGIGIDPADHQRIFERFVQVDGTPSRRAGGAGLGLAITAALVDLMGGSIRVESTPGAGARFIVALPLAPAATREASGASPA
ncbi:MAG TPA: ATP-binding protein [Amaricoccus sp.]|nr:ATP-binding protein [Amaricoccus sp.]